MSTLYNPALHEEPQNQSTKVIPPIARESLLNWLENVGRFKTYEADDLQIHHMTEELDDILEPEYFVKNDEEQLDQEE